MDTDTPVDKQKLFGNVPGVARDAIAEAIGSLTGSNHFIEPPSATDAQSQPKPTILPKFESSTAFFTVTHGAPAGIRASKPSSGPPPAVMTEPEMYYIPDILNAVTLQREPYLQNRIISPPHSSNGYGVVLLLACRAAFDRSSAAKAFGIGNGTPQGLQQVKNQCLIGFSFEVSAMVENRIEGWVNRFITALVNGKTVEAAVREAQDGGKIPSFMKGGEPIRAGDDKTKFRGLYEKEGLVWSHVS